MATTPLNILITWFQTGDKPTGEQYEQMLRSLAHQDDLQNVIDLLNSKVDTDTFSAILDSLKPIVLSGQNNYQFTVLRRVADVIVIAPTPTAVGAGLTPGGNELTEPIASNADGNNLGVTHFFKAGDSIYFTGILPDTQLIIF